MNNEKVFTRMNTRAFAGYLLKNKGRVVDFGVNFDAKLQTIAEGDCEKIFGAQIMWFCDTWIVLVGEYGGGFNRTEDLTDFVELEEYLLRFFEAYFEELESEIGIEISDEFIAVEVLE